MAYNVSLTESTFERIVHHLGYLAVLSDVWWHVKYIKTMKENMFGTLHF